ATWRSVSAVMLTTAEPSSVLVPGHRPTGVERVTEPAPVELADAHTVPRGTAGERLRVRPTDRLAARACARVGRRLAARALDGPDVGQPLHLARALEPSVAAARTELVIAQVGAPDAVCDRAQPRVGRSTAAPHLGAAAHELVGVARVAQLR